jgi:hypothetical protein
MATTTFFVISTRAFSNRLYSWTEATTYLFAIFGKNAPYPNFKEGKTANETCTSNPPGSETTSLYNYNMAYLKKTTEKEAGYRNL